MAVEIPVLGYLPARGPSSQISASALRPPTICMVAAPAGSINPAPSEKFRPRPASHPPPHTQCITSGQTTPATTAVAAQPAASRQRSAPLPHGIMAANATPNISNKSASCAGAGADPNPESRNEPEAIQFQG